MTDVLGLIDAAIDGLCPCGGEPALGSAYCGDDCTPTHIASDTDPSGPGEYGAQSTPMRWRPDLVTEHNDSRLTLATQFRRGRYNATVYEINDSDGVHCRLDDGNRFVGIDADGYQFASPEGLEPVWQRLERELGDSRRLDPEADPWADAWDSLYGGLYERYRARAEEHERRFAAHLDGFAAGAVRAGQAVTYHFTPESSAPSNGRVFIAPVGADPSDPSEWTELGVLTEDGTATYATSWDSPDSNPLRDIRSFTQQRIAASFQMPPGAIRSIRESFERAGEALRRAFSEPGASRPPGPEHPMLAAIEARRNRNTGPGQRQRAPRQINPRRGR